MSFTRRRSSKRFLCQKPDCEGGPHSKTLILKKSAGEGFVGCRKWSKRVWPFLTVGLLTLSSQRRRAGNDLDNLARDRRLTNAIHVQRQGRNQLTSVL